MPALFNSLWGRIVFPAILSCDTGERHSSASGFDATYCKQPDSVALTLKMLMGVVPGVVLVMSTICLYFYSIDGKRAKEIQIQLEELR